MVCIGPAVDRPGFGSDGGGKDAALVPALVPVNDSDASMVPVTGNGSDASSSAFLSVELAGVQHDLVQKT